MVLSLFLGIFLIFRCYYPIFFLLLHIQNMTLDKIHIGKNALITQVGGEGALRQHFLDMGLIPGVIVTVEKYAPMGDPLQIHLHGYSLTLRKADAAKITVVADVEIPEKTDPEHTILEHPGLGEGGRFHDPTHENPLPENTLLRFALVGNQNCGKTTLFNQLTGANQHVGNFPGVTVDRKMGVIRGYKNTEVTDLPGIYSLSPYTQEEVISREFIIGPTKPNASYNPVSCIINIVDATNIERNLYLTMQLMELNIPMVLALNFMDEMEGNGGTILVNAMEKTLGLPVIPISASKNQGVSELIDHAIHVAQYQEAPARQDFCSPQDHGGAVHRCLHAIMHLIEDHAVMVHFPVRFAAAKLVEGDASIEKALGLSKNEEETIEHIRKQMEEERGMDRAAAMADMRYSFIENLCANTVVHPKKSKEAVRSAAIDKVLTGKWTALPTFFLIMAVIFWLTFDLLGGTMQEWLEEFVDWFTQRSDETLISWKVEDWVRSLIIDGVYAGVGTVASFVPIIVVLFFFLSMLEDTGYMARIAFVMDKSLRKIGLSGRSIVPLLIGFGCSVPAVMSSRTLPSERDRRLSVTLIPFMSCTAKLPIYAFFCAVFFPENAALVMCGLYLLGILVGIIAAFIMKHGVFRGEAVPFVMELPNYRLPSAKTTFMLLWEKARDFLQRAFTVIFCATIVIWFLQSFSFQLHVVEDESQSILGVTASMISPLLAPIGLDDWRITTSLVSGFLAKESVVSTLTVLFGESTPIASVLSIPAVISLLVFSLLYTPCVAAIAAIRRELGNKDALAVVFFQCLIAYIVSFIAYNIALL